MHAGRFDTLDRNRALLLLRVPARRAMDNYFQLDFYCGRMFTLAIVKEAIIFVYEQFVPRATISHRLFIVAIMISSRG